MGTRLAYFVERWSTDDQRCEEVVAMRAGVQEARVAFNASIIKEPSKRWYIRNRTRVVDKHPNDNFIKRAK